MWFPNLTFSVAKIRKVERKTKEFIHFFAETAYLRVFFQSKRYEKSELQIKTVYK